MSKVWRHADGREFPATYHYAQDMPDYHSAQVGNHTVSQTLMRELGYTLIERETKEEKMEGVMNEVDVTAEKAAEMQGGSDESPRLTLDTIQELTRMMRDITPGIWVRDSYYITSPPMRLGTLQACAVCQMILGRFQGGNLDFIVAMQNNAKALLHYAALGLASESSPALQPEASAVPEDTEAKLKEAVELLERYLNSDENEEDLHGIDAEARAFLEGVKK